MRSTLPHAALTGRYVPLILAGNPLPQHDTQRQSFDVILFQYKTRFPTTARQPRGEPSTPNKTPTRTGARQRPSDTTKVTHTTASTTAAWRNPSHLQNSFGIFMFFYSWGIWWSFFRIWLESLGPSGTEAGTLVGYRAVGRLHGRLRPRHAAHLPVPGPVRAEGRAPQGGRPERPVLLQGPLARVLPAAPLRHPVGPVPLGSCLQRGHGHLVPRAHRLRPVPRTGEGRRVQAGNRVPPVGLRPQFLRAAVVQHERAANHIRVDEPLRRADPHAGRRLVRTADPAARDHAWRRRRPSLRHRGGDPQAA